MGLTFAAVVGLSLLLEAPRHCANAFVSAAAPSRRSGTTTAFHATEEDASFMDNMQLRWKIGQESRAEGADFKQVVADVLAGEYDAEPIEQQIESEIPSAPVVMYTWEKSPACKKAVQGFELALGVSSLAETSDVRIIRLDDPWDEGNPIRAQLGKKVGRTSVPCIFIGGEYVGGFDEGVGGSAPGIQAMAFQGTLRPALEAAGVSLGAGAGAATTPSPEATATTE